jgi:hypothetical protein
LVSFAGFLELTDLIKTYTMKQFLPCRPVEQNGCLSERLEYVVYALYCSVPMQACMGTAIVKIGEDGQDHGAL